MVFNVDYDSNKGFKMMIFLLIILIFMFTAEYLVMYAQGENENAKLNYITGGRMSSIFEGHWEGYLSTTMFQEPNGNWVYSSMKYYWVVNNSKARYGPYGLDSYRQITDDMANHPEKVPFEATTKDNFTLIDALGFLWNMLTFSIVPFPFNIIPAVLSTIMMMFVGYFIIALASGFMPSWL